MEIKEITEEKATELEATKDEATNEEVSEIKGKSSQSTRDLKEGDRFKGKITTRDHLGNKTGTVSSTFRVIFRSERDIFTLNDSNNITYKGVRKNDIEIESEKNNEQNKLENSEATVVVPPQENVNTIEQITNFILAGLNNIWLVGPAGCGKTTMVTEVAKMLEMDCYILPCGIGTSSAEFIGYKYPNREKTKFAEYYQNKSIILLDEFSALDPSVAQIANSALANGVLETTTGTVLRHSECIIIATSNTYGSGASRQYVSNNPLDASTIDRFAGGMIDVDYDVEYEKRFDKEVVDYVYTLREVITENKLRRIASTRSIINGEKLKLHGVKNWREVLVTNWTNVEKEILFKKLYEITNRS